MERIFVHGAMYSGERMFAERLLEHLVFNRNLLWDMINTMGFRHYKLNPNDSLDMLERYDLIKEKLTTKTESLTNANFNGMIIRGLASSLQVERLLEEYPNDRHFFFKRAAGNGEQALLKRAGNMVNVIPSLTVDTIIEYNKKVNGIIDNIVMSRQLEWNPVIVKKTDITEELLPAVDESGNAGIMFAVLN